MFINLIMLRISMEKRAQVAMFMILGIVIVAVIGISLYFRGVEFGASSMQQQSERESLNIEARQFAESVDRCVEKTLAEAIIEVSRNGGEYPAAGGSIKYKSYSVPIYYDNGKGLIYSKDKIKSSMEDYVSRNLAACVKGIGSDYEHTDTVSSRITFGKETRVEIYMPLKLGDSKLTYFSGIIDFDYGIVYSDMSSFYNKVKAFNGTIEFMGMAEMAQSSGYRFSHDYLDDSVIYIMGWDEPVLVSRLEFPFAVRKNASAVFHDEAEPEYVEEEDGAVSDSDVPPEDPDAGNVDENSEINISMIENDEGMGELIAKL